MDAVTFGSVSGVTWRGVQAHRDELDTLEETKTAKRRAKRQHKKVYLLPLRYVTAKKIARCVAAECNTQSFPCMHAVCILSFHFGQLFGGKLEGGKFSFSFTFKEIRWTYMRVLWAASLRESYLHVSGPERAYSRPYETSNVARV